MTPIMSIFWNLLNSFSVFNVLPIYSFQQPTVWSVPASCDVVDACRVTNEPPTTESLLDTFTAEERAVLSAIPASKDTDDLLLLAQLHKKGQRISNFTLLPNQLRLK